jgi:hypothetical protein
MRQPGAGSRRAQAARASLAGLLAIAALICLASAAAAQVVSAEGVSVGLQPRSTSLSEGEGVTGFESANGSPIVSSSAVTAIYWDPKDLYHGDWQGIVDRFLRNMGQASGSLGNVFAVDTQYTDLEGEHAASHTSFAGSYTDTDSYPSGECTDPAPLVEGDAVTCLTSKQIEDELKTFVKDHSLPTGMSNVYYLLTPPGVTVCLGAGSADCSDYLGEAEAGNPSYAGSFCSYHSDIEPGLGGAGSASTILYGVVPWIAGGLGDYHLGAKNRTAEYRCQAGGWTPGLIEEPPELKEEKPTQQEPNQTGRGPDGSFDTGLADLIVSQIGVEQQDIVTDPLLNAWQTAGGREVTDVCRNFFAPARGGSNAPLPNTGAGNLYNQVLSEGAYFVNDSFNLAGTELSYPGIPCLNSVALSPSFTTPTDVNAGEIVGFDGMESDIALNQGTTYSGGKPAVTYPTFEWNFGDGSSVKGYAPGAPSKNSPETTLCELPWESPCAASAFHTYAYGGTYEVTLTVTDVGGNIASVSKTITVDGPPPPSGPGSGSSGASGSSSASGSGSGSGAGSNAGPGSGGSLGVTGTAGTSSSPGGTAKSAKPGAGHKPKAATIPLPKPVATAIIATTSLTKAIEAGLKVRYSVNQQVAGHFEVLIPTRVARRLKIEGRPVTGLPKGAPKQTLIAYALLITTRKAHGTMNIVIPARIGSHMARLHHVTLILRLVVRNASRSRPKKTLLQTAVKLRR